MCGRQPSLRPITRPALSGRIAGNFSCLPVAARSQHEAAPVGPPPGLLTAGTWLWLAAGRQLLVALCTTHWFGPAAAAGALQQQGVVAASNNPVSGGIGSPEQQAVQPQDAIHQGGPAGAAVADTGCTCYQLQPESVMHSPPFPGRALADKNMLQLTQGKKPPHSAAAAAKATPCSSQHLLEPRCCCVKSLMLRSTQPCLLTWALALEPASLHQPTAATHLAAPLDQLRSRSSSSSGGSQA